VTLDQRSGLDRRAPWIDHTIRPPGEPEIDYNPESGEFELSWKWDSDDRDVTGRLTLLLPADVLDRLTQRARELLGLIVPAITIALIP